MRTDVRHRIYPRRHRPSTMMVRYGRVFLVQGGFNVCCIFDDALVVTKNISGFTFRHGNTKTAQFEAQVLHRF